MNDKSNTDHSNYVRLAENEAVAVDMCRCGSLQVHLGELSLRLPPEVVTNLVRTLGAALTRRQTLLASPTSGELTNTSWSGGEAPRGKA